MISVQQLTRQFGEGPEAVLAVDRLSFQVQPKEVYGLLGPNGAGKTTTLEWCWGSSNHPQATWRFSLSCFSHADEVKRQIGLVSASAGLYQWLTPRESWSSLRADMGSQKNTQRFRWNV